MSHIEDLTPADVDAFIVQLQGNHLGAEDVQAIAVALQTDDPSINPAAVSVSFTESNDMLSFLCSAKPTLVNAVVNNALFGHVSAGKGVLLRDFLCHFVAADKENRESNADLNTWLDLDEAGKRSLLRSWKDRSGAS